MTDTICRPDSIPTFFSGPPCIGDILEDANGWLVQLVPRPHGDALKDHVFYTLRGWTSQGHVPIGSIAFPATRVAMVVSGADGNDRLTADNTVFDQPFSLSEIRTPSELDF